MLKVKVKKLHQDAIIPKPATDGAACFDLHALGDGAIGHIGNTLQFRTGLSFEIPQGYAMMIYSRSGHGFKNHVRLANCVGVIDSDYRGEVGVKLVADDGGEKVSFQPGDRIAQAMIIPVPMVGFEEVDELSSTERGVGGFGSTGQSSGEPL